VVLYKSLIKQRRLAELKNEFIGNITHELKTPIATVGVAIEALKNFNAMLDPERTREYLDISSHELQRLGLLVDKVLKLSMFEKREFELQYETFDLRNVVDEVVASMRLQIEKYHAVITVTQKGDTNLQADRLHLLSVVFNLVDNALKYGTEQPLINISLDGDNNTVQMKVADNGIGIAPEYQNKIFEKFFRIPTGNMHNTKGYGLGLSYVAHVVKKHNGKISVDSKLGVGTTITVSIPKNIT
jgi:two-component system phosphate regulon sensor histidine kinase PhoR